MLEELKEHCLEEGKIKNSVYLREKKLKEAGLYDYVIESAPKEYRPINKNTRKTIK